MFKPASISSSTCSEIRKRFQNYQRITSSGAICATKQTLLTSRNTDKFSNNGNLFNTVPSRELLCWKIFICGLQIMSASQLNLVCVQECPPVRPAYAMDKSVWPTNKWTDKRVYIWFDTNTCICMQCFDVCNHDYTHTGNFPGLWRIMSNTKPFTLTFTCFSVNKSLQMLCFCTPFESAQQCEATRPAKCAAQNK